MPEYLRAYIVVVSLFFGSFWLIKKIKPDFIGQTQLSKWRNYWILIASISFLSPNVWVYLFSLIIILVSVRSSPTEKPIFFLAILCSSPLFNFTVPGFGVINYLIKLSYFDVLAIFLLIPIYKYIHNKSWRLNSYDKCVLVYVMLISVLAVSETSITHGTRLAVQYSLSIGLPYFVLSRAINSTIQLQKTAYALLFCLIPMAVIGCFESIKYWKLYSSAFSHVLGEGNNLAYRLRGGSLRASALFSSPIVLGYAMVIGLGFLIYIKNHTTKKNILLGIGFLFLVSLYFTKARGPWLGLAVLVILYLWSGPKKLSKLTSLFLGGAIALIPLSLTTTGMKFIEMLPFFSSQESHEASTVDYRLRLIEQGWIVFQKNPILGSITYRETPEMEVMRQGQGIIDVVNSYIHIALSYGIVGLTLFVFVFLGLFITVYKSIKSLPSSEVQLIYIGRTLFAVLGSIIFMIFTVSSIDFIPILYWSIAGICSAYIKICNHKRNELNHTNPQPHPTQATSP